MNDNQQNKLIPKLRFPEFKDSGEWEEKKLGEIFKIGSGKDYKHLSTGNIPVYGSGGYMTSVNDYLYEGESVCIGRKGTIDKPMFLNGKFWTVDTLFYTYSFNECIVKFIYYIFQNINWLNHNEAGGIPSLSKNNIYRIKIKIPQPVEQQKITSCLSSLDELLEAHKQKLELLKAHKKGLMQNLFPQEGEKVPKLRFPEFKDIGEWEEKVLNSFIKERKEISNEDNPLYSLTIEDGITPKSERYERSFLVKNEKEAYKILYPYDFAYNPMNLRFGAIALHQGKTKVALSKYYNIFYCDDSADPRFCEFYFKSNQMLTLYDDIATGSLVEKRRVHFSAFLKLKIPFPKKKEQQKIAECLSSIDELITAETEKIEQLEKHKKGLMQGLFPMVNG